MTHTGVPTDRSSSVGWNTGCLLATSDDEMGKNGPVPSGCGENPAILHSRPRRWTRHSLQARLHLHPTNEDLFVGTPGLAGFSLATLPTAIGRYTLALQTPENPPEKAQNPPRVFPSRSEPAQHQP